MQAQEDHLRIIEQAVLSGCRNAGDEWRTASWARCLRGYNLDPNRLEVVQLEDAALKHERDFFQNDTHVAGHELEKTLAMIEGGGYSAQLTNANGVIIDHRLSRDETYYCSTDALGTVWSEEVGGTNGIGTALVTEQTAAVYLADHFFAGITGQACVGAPFFGPTGEVLGVVNLSTRNASLPRLAHRVVSGIAQVSAERLEQQYFRKHYSKFHTLHLETNETGPCILAVDDDFCIVGASRNARMRFRLDKDAIGRKSLWMLFEKLRGDPTLHSLRENLRQLRPLGESDLIGTLVMQPQSALPKNGGIVAPIVVRKAAKVPLPTSAPMLADCAGQDPVMQRNVEILQRMEGMGLNILLLGETGVGKDTLARALHLESDRVGGPFVAFNCAAVPESLIDSELFGYSAGAFTGANRTGSPGRIVEADRGTLFLDEIGDMPLTLQTRLLRFLETNEVSPLGGGKPRLVDVQIIAATHQDLPQAVSEARFRQDLYYRLAGVTAHLPALRDRQDLAQIVQSVLGRLADGKQMTISDAALTLLLRHDWPGNIRELRNVLSRAVRLARDGQIATQDLLFDRIGPAPTVLRVQADEAMGADAPPRPRAVKPAKPSVLAQAERAALVQAIAEAGGNAEACAAALGCSRATLYRKLKLHGLSLSA